MLEAFAASQIALYINAGVIEGRGGAQIALGASRSVRADAFAYDLRSGRLLLAGHVDLVDRAANDAPRELHAAAIVRTPNGTIYALVTAPTPQRERLDSRTLQPTAQEAPSDAFAFPNIAEAPWMSATSADVVPGTLVTLHHATFLYPARGATVPSYVYVFSPSTYYATTSLPYASFDQPWPFRGGPHALDTLHVRYDQIAGASLGFDHRLVFGDRGYALLSLAPLTQSARSAELTIYQRMSNAVYESLSAFGARGGALLQSPTQASLSLNYGITAALRQSYLQLSLNQAYDSLIAGGAPNHPSHVQLGWYGYDEPLGRSGFHYRLHSALGHLHDAFGLGSQVDPPQATDAWSKGVGLSLSTPVYKVPLGIQLSAYGERDLTWFSSGPGYGQTGDNLTVTAARPISQRLGAVASYQSLSTSSPRTLYRTTALNLTYQVPALAVALSLQHNSDFVAPPTGLTTPFTLIPRPPYEAAVDLRIRISRYGTLDLQRSYFFNFEGEKWSPRFTISLLP
ncbi:MAG: hypothetical protein KGM44_05185 [bacterium]|nr:hypothetical protein [bacterium]